MGNELIRKVECQPSWLVVAIKKTITDLPDGCAEAAEWLGVTENALFSRLCVDGDRIFSLGRAMVLQRAGGSTHIADVVARHSQDVFAPLADVDDLDNADINRRLMESIEWTGRHSNFVRKVAADGVIDANEHAQVRGNSYQVTTKSQEHVILLCQVFCVAEKSDARECAVPGALANNFLSMEEQPA